MIPFKVGDEVICDCGAKQCVPFVITKIEENGDCVFIHGPDEMYMYPEDYKLRKLTKLEKALK